MKMRFFETIGSRFNQAFHRFPLATIIACVLTGFGLYFTHNDYDGAMAVICALFVTFVLVVAGYLLAEVRKAKRPTVFLLGALILGLGSYFWFDSYGTRSDELFLGFVCLSFVSVVLLSLVPFFGVKKLVEVKKEQAYFGFLGVLLNLVLSAFVYFGALYLGLVLVLFSLEFLFDFAIRGEWFLDLFALIAGLLVSHFLLAGLPKSFEKFEESGLVHAVANFLPKYVLAPLTWVYLVVLYVYVAKIGLEMSWPEGGVAGWIIGFSLVGILTEIVLRFRKCEDFAYVVVLRKVFYWLLIPLLGVLYAALVVRVLDYGVTETRYLGLMLADFILVVTAYNLFSKLKGLRVVVGVLAVMVFVGTMGPLSAQNMSFNSQVERLGMLLVENGIYVNGEVKEVPDTVSSEGYEEIRALVDYMTWSLSEGKRMNEYFGLEDGQLQEVLGLGYEDSPSGISEGEKQVSIYFTSVADENRDYNSFSVAYPVGGFDFLLPNFSVGDYGYNHGGEKFSFGGESVLLGVVNGDLVVNGRGVEMLAWFKGLKELKNGSESFYNFSDQKVLTFRFAEAGYDFELRLSSAAIVVDAVSNEVKKVSNVNGTLFAKKR